MSRRIALLVSLTLVAAGCSDEPMTEAEIHNFKELHDRPAEIDTSRVESFEIEINGENGFTGHPQAVAGGPIEFKGQIDLKEGVLTHMISGSLRVGHRKVEDGAADWTIGAVPYHEFFVGTLQLDKKDSNKIDAVSTKNRLKPGLYELRYYLLLKKFRPEKDFDEFVGIYFLNTGTLEVLPAAESK